MIEGRRLRDLEVLSLRTPVKGLRVTIDVEIAPREVVLVELDLAGTSHVHEVRTLVARKGPFQRCPVRLVCRDWDIGRVDHMATP
jgi:hypothetical protein